MTSGKTTANFLEGSESGRKSSYDPFERGPFPVGVRTFELADQGRAKRFPCEVWYPAAAQHAGQDLIEASQDTFRIAAGNTPRKQMAVRDGVARFGSYPLIIYSHHSGGHRRTATFLCTHLSSHGYVVAALDHSEVIAPELARVQGETPGQKAARWEAVIASRIPDLRLLLEHVLAHRLAGLDLEVDSSRIGVVGHSFGGWAALAINDVETRIRAVVALAPGGDSKPRPGVLPLKLAFKWRRDVPTMYLVAENDVALPLSGMYEIYERTPATKRMVILRRADHMHFVDNVEEMHESGRTMPLPAELAWMQKEMRPMAELCSGEQARLFVRSLTLSHLDATLRENREARRFLSADLEVNLRKRDVDVVLYRPEAPTES